MPIKSIFVIGAGTMGAGIAQVAATSGYQVTCMDVVPAALERAQAAIHKSAAKLEEKSNLSAEQRGRVDHIEFVQEMGAALKADILIAPHPGAGTFTSRYWMEGTSCSTMTAF